MSPSGRSVNAARISRGARRTTAGGTSKVSSWASSPLRSRISPLPRILTSRATNRTTGVRRTSPASTKSMAPSSNRSSRSRGRSSAAATAPRTGKSRSWPSRISACPCPAGPSAVPVMLRPGLQPAAQVPAPDGGQERLGARVPELEVDRVARRGGEADGHVAAERSVRELTAKRREGEVAAAEPERGGERPNVEAIGDPERGDRELSCARQRAADPRPGRRQLDALGSEQGPLSLSRRRRACRGRGPGAAR